MNETRRRKEVIGICVAVAATYIAMYVLTLMYEAAISSGNYNGHIIKTNVVALIIALIVGLIPYEKITYIWKRVKIGDLFDFIFLDSNRITDKNSARVIVGAFVPYCILASLCVWIADGLLQSDGKTVRLIAFFLTVFMTWIIVNSFELIKSDTWLFVIGMSFVILNAAVVYLVTESFYYTTFIGVAMFVGWNVCYFLSTRKRKFLCLLASFLIGVGTFIVAVMYSGKYEVLEAWFSPEKEASLWRSWEWMALRQQFLKMPAGFPEIRMYAHPFVAANHYLGLGALIVLFMAFAIITAAYIRSYKLLSINRFSLLTFIYLIFAVTYLYTFLADVGLIPTAGSIPLISEEIYIVAIGILIRLCITRPARMKSLLESIELEDDEEDFDYEEEQGEKVKPVRLPSNTEMVLKSRQTAHLLFKYVIKLDHEINLINRNLDNILEKIGEDRIEDYDDGYEEKVRSLKGTIPRNIEELEEEIMKIYRGEEETK